MSTVPEPIFLSSPPTDDLLSSAPDWAIYLTGSSEAAIVPDTFVGISERGESHASDYPVEEGAFASYNKVQTPTEFRLRLACAGERMSRGDFLDQVKAMKEGTDLYDIATPEALYESYTLTRYDYARQNGRGVSLLVVELIFEEVRQTASSGLSSSSGPSDNVTSDSPSANDPVNQGLVSPIDPTAAQAAALQPGGML